MTGDGFYGKEKQEVFLCMPWTGNPFDLESSGSVQPYFQKKMYNHVGMWFR